MLITLISNNNKKDLYLFVSQNIRHHTSKIEKKLHVIGRLQPYN